MSDSIIYSQLAKDLRNDAFRKSISNNTIQQLIKDLDLKFKDIKQLSATSHATKQQCQTVQIILECLRNCCVSCQRNQLIIIHENVAVKIILDILEFEQSTNWSEELTKIKKISLQFLANLTTGNKTCQDVLWQKLFPTIALQLLETLPTSLKDILCMIILNCVRESSEIWSNKNFMEVISRIIEFVNIADSEWGLLMLEHILLKGNFSDVYSQMDCHHKQRLALLDLLQAYVDDEGFEVPENAFTFISDTYKEALAVNTSLTVSADVEHLRKLADLSLALLRVLCSATGSHKYKEVTNDINLLDFVVNQLVQISLYTKGRENSLSFDLLHKESLFGFKRDLIRLIGNLCFKNKKHQDRVRELGGIPAILDNCGIDDENPYIRQWAIFTIRNLCDNNLDNQRLISQLDHKGLANDAVKEQLGIDCNLVDGKIQIGSKNRKK